MILVADESVDQPIVVLLRASGHEVTAIAEIAPSISDDDVLRRTNAARAILITADKDFGEMIYRQRQTSHGVVLIRLAGLSAMSKARIVEQALREHDSFLVDRFTVIEPDTIRSRPRLTLD